MMRRGIALGLLLLATPAVAQARPDTTRLTCAEARSLVTRSGAVVLGTGGPTYDRFVADRRFCEATEITKTSFAATRDQASCFVGYRCIEPSNDDWFDDN